MSRLGGGISLFNQGLFREAHDAWEAPWRMLPESSEKQFIKGLIMIAAAFVHFRKGEQAGTVKLLERGKSILEACGGTNTEIDVASLLREVSLLLERARVSLDSMSERDIPKIRTLRSEKLQ